MATAYTHDLADRITSITYPSGRIVKYTYDSKGRVVQVRTKASALLAWTVLATDHSYEAVGVLRQVTLGNGLAAANDWSNEGRVTARRLWRTIDGVQLSHLAYGYDADDNVASVTNQLGPAGSAIYGYDKVGRRSLTVTDPGGAVTQTLAYTPGTNRLASVTGAAGFALWAMTDAATPFPKPVPARSR